jgi:hypothetical protein
VGPDDHTVYTSVLQDFQDTYPWFTVPVDTFAYADAGTGSSWYLDLAGETDDILRLIYVKSQAIRRLGSYGRY